MANTTTARRGGRAATHYGECQICGRMQKLPSGVMAKHGYTTRWGFFSGVCTGSDYRPFEQATNAIERAIERAAASRDFALARAAELDREATDLTVETEVFVSGGYARRREVRTGTLARVDGHLFLHVRHIDEPMRVCSTIMNPDLLAVATRLNRERAAQLRRSAAQYQEYVDWQTERVANWTPRDLKPVESAR